MCLLSCTSTYLGVIFCIFNFIKISDTLVSDSLSLTQTETCKITLNNGQIIDLSSFLKSNEPLIAATNASLYIYHPCKEVKLNTTKPNDCQKGYVLCYFEANSAGNGPLDYNKVLSNTIEGNFSLLALNDELVPRENRLKEPELVYKHRHNQSVMINTYIELECDKKVENYALSAMRRISPFEHMLMLTSRHYCFETPHYMSGVTVFFIVLIVFLMLYFIGGILVLKFIRGATGVEMIPNHEFWCNLPQHMKNGFTYLASCGKRTPDGYETI